ncbi:endonuclease III domain-containing protein [Haladaptatus sp. ZSTT2]|uniref:endonuclease III domain-containing protein n=1 Tax=Haladaptatus sp. ZSTT2 TaxID=3120515 RepID=UPI00300F5EBA
MPEEPANNISGGIDGGGRPAEFSHGEPASRAEAVIDRLGELYWQKQYGGQDAFTCLVRTILSQNTSDVASQPAHNSLLSRYGRDDLAVSLAGAAHDELAATIKSAGLYNQKATVIIDAASRILEEYGSAASFDEFVRDETPETVRSALLDIRGVGPKTADCVLLFGGGRDGVFPVDTHVHRIYRRLGIAPPDADHEEVRAVLEREVPAEKCGFGHTASIQFGREYCTARKPACLDDPDACPMADLCDQVGVYPVDGDVVDPAETV